MLVAARTAMRLGVDALMAGMVVYASQAYDAVALLQRSSFVVIGGGGGGGGGVYSPLTFDEQKQTHTPVPLVPWYSMAIA